MNHYLSDIQPRWHYGHAASSITHWQKPANNAYFKIDGLCLQRYTQIQEESWWRIITVVEVLLVKSKEMVWNLNRMLIRDRADWGGHLDFLRAPQFCGYHFRLHRHFIRVGRFWNFPTGEWELAHIRTALNEIGRLSSLLILMYPYVTPNGPT